MKRVLFAAGALGATLVVTGGCVTNGSEAVPTDLPRVTVSSIAAVPAPSVSAAGLSGPGSRASRDGLTIQVTGSCADIRGFRLASNGFTPNGAYLTKALYPDGTPYTFLINGGRGTAAADGSTPNWTWDCRDGKNGQPDPPGIYELVMTDLETGRWVAAQFEVRY